MASRGVERTGTVNDRSACHSVSVRGRAAALGCAVTLLAVSCQRDEPKPAVTTSPEPVTTNEAAAARSSEPRLPAPPPAVPSLAAPAPAPASSAASVYEACVGLCSHSRELKCSNAARCPGACRDMASDVACAEHLLAAMRCFAAQPTSRWACGDDGLAAVKDGNCDREQSRYVECVGHAAGQ